MYALLHIESQQVFAVMLLYMHFARVSPTVVIHIPDDVDWMVYIFSSILYDLQRCRKIFTVGC